MRQFVIGTLNNYFFFLLPGGPGMNGLLSPPFSIFPSGPMFSPGITPIVASVTTF